MKKTILFDLDGTLIDSTEAIVEGFGISFETHKKSAPKAKEIIKLVGHPLEIMFEGLGVEKDMIKSHVDAYKKHYRTIATAKTTLLEGAKESIELASKFARIGVVTTKTRRYSIDILEHLGIGHYFETIVGRECVQNPKPHPEPIMLALTRMGLQKDGTFFVGDTMMDLLAAREAGVEFVGVEGIYGDMKLFKKECNVLKNNILVAVSYIKTREI
ncbi:MAG: HAD family hydrolase [Campylobacterales bacterium]